jgi:hypothetical protein
MGAQLLAHTNPELQVNDVIRFGERCRRTVGPPTRFLSWEVRTNKIEGMMGDVELEEKKM